MRFLRRQCPCCNRLFYLNFKWICKSIFKNSTEDNGPRIFCPNCFKGIFYKVEKKGFLIILLYITILIFVLVFTQSYLMFMIFTFVLLPFVMIAICCVSPLYFPSREARFKDHKLLFFLIFLCSLPIFLPRKYLDYLDLFLEKIFSLL